MKTVCLHSGCMDAMLSSPGKSCTALLNYVQATQIHSEAFSIVEICVPLEYEV